MNTTNTAFDDPHEPSARAHRARAVHVLELSASDPSVLPRLAEWQREATALLDGPLLPETRLRLGDHLRVAAELSRVLSGAEAGEGRDADRRMFAAISGGTTQALCAWFACPGGVFIELVVTAPWNLLRPGDPSDARAVRGAGAEIVAAAIAHARPRGGRVALQAENRRAAEVYARWGFVPMTFVDRPLTVVPPGESGWSPEILRVARGCPGPEEARMPWLVLDPARAAAGAGARAAAAAPDARLACA